MSLLSTQPSYILFGCNIRRRLHFFCKGARRRLAFYLYATSGRQSTCPSTSRWLVQMDLACSYEVSALQLEQEIELQLECSGSAASHI